MSNCVTVHNAIAFRPDDIDAAALKAAIDAAPARPAEWKENATEQEIEQRCISWFLKGEALEFCPNGDVGWFAGDGNSTHTWRDLRWALSFLNKFIKLRGTVVLEMTDDDNDPNEFFKVPVNFGGDFDADNKRYWG